MRAKYFHLHKAYMACKTEEGLREYLRRLDMDKQREKIKNQSLNITVRFFHVESSNYHAIQVSPLISLETLLGIHTKVSKFSYSYLHITNEDGKPIDFCSSRKKPLIDLKIMNQSVLNVKDLKQRPKIPPVFKDDHDEIVKEFMDSITKLVKIDVKKTVESMKPERREKWGENGSIIQAINRYFTQPENKKTIMAEEIDRFDGTSPYGELYSLSLKLLEEGSFYEATVANILVGYIMQCQLTGTQQVVTYFNTLLWGSIPGVYQ